MLDHVATVDNAYRLSGALVERVDLFQRVQDGRALDDGAEAHVLLVQIRLRL